MKFGTCIVETRPLVNLREIIQERHLNFLPDDCGLTCFLSVDNMHMIKQEMFSRELKIIIIEPEMNERKYNSLLTSPWFWEQLNYDKILIFQHDSELLKKGIETYLHYDFIGAQDIRKGCEDKMNGGLSIRDVAKSKLICEQFQYNHEMNEDWWFCIYMNMIGAIIPNSKLDHPFSIEQEFRLGSLGCHAIDKWFTQEQCKQIRGQYK